MSMCFRVGDYVTMFDQFTAQVVCDYDRKECMTGYESLLEGPVWDLPMDCGYMLWTAGMNFVYYEEISEDDLIDFEREASDPEDRLQPLEKKMTEDEHDQGFSISHASNTQAPAAAVITSLGYQLEFETRSGHSWWRAKNGTDAFRAREPVELLGLITMAQHGGQQWKADQEEFEDMFRVIERGTIAADQDEFLENSSQMLHLLHERVSNAYRGMKLKWREDLSHTAKVISSSHAPA